MTSWTLRGFQRTPGEGTTWLLSLRLEGQQGLGRVQGLDSGPQGGTRSCTVSAPGQAHQPKACCVPRTGGAEACGALRQDGLVETAGEAARTQVLRPALP